MNKVIIDQIKQTMDKIEECVVHLQKGKRKGEGRGSGRGVSLDVDLKRCKGWIAKDDVSEEIQFLKRFSWPYRQLETIRKF